MPINRITIKSEGSILYGIKYTGYTDLCRRYHHGNIKTPDLFQEAGKTEPSKTRYLKDEVLKDTVTFSDEGLAKSKNWREYLKDDPVMVSSFHYQKQREELNKQLHTVNIIDPVSMFQCELGEVASGIEAEYKRENILVPRKNS